jgi:hypothetical protein
MMLLEPFFGENRCKKDVESEILMQRETQLGRFEK